MPADPRRAPNEDAVRGQLRQEEELVAEAQPEAVREAGDAPVEAEPEAAEPGPDGEPEVVDGEPTGAAAESDNEPELEEAGEPEIVDAKPVDAESEDAAPAAAEPVEEEPLERAERERGEYLALAQRTQADFENYRKRAARDAAAAGERAKTGLVRELLPAVDNLERALASAQEGEGHLAGGVELVHAELIGVLARNGVEPFDPSGERFDPEQHEALSTRPDEGSDSGVVLDVVERGYRLNGTVLRPARVVVSG